MLPLIEQQKRPRLFPHGLSPNDINSSLEPARRRASDVVRDRDSEAAFGRRSPEAGRRLRLGSSPAVPVGYRARWVNSMSGSRRGTQHFDARPNLDRLDRAPRGAGSVFDPMRACTLETVARVAVSIAESGAPEWARAVPFAITRSWASPTTR